MTNPERVVMSPGVYRRELADAHARGVEDALRPVRDLIRRAKLITTSKRAVILVADLESALDGTSR